MAYSEDEYLQMSGIQHFCYCRRQWALIHIEQAWTEDARTAAGRIFHERADDAGLREVRGGKAIVRALDVSSPSLGLSGRCDVVEFTLAGGRGGAYGGASGCTVCPVEYKVGRTKPDDRDAVQLCAQAIALEETLSVDVDSGFLFYGQEHRRRQVDFDAELRRETRALAGEMHAMFESGEVPPGAYSGRCRGCSLLDRCMPLRDPPCVAAYICGCMEG